MKAGEDNQFRVTLTMRRQAYRRCSRNGHAHHARDAFDEHAGDEEFLRVSVEGRQPDVRGQGPSADVGHMECNLLRRARTAM
jgi:hypothetical protein